MRLMMQPLDVPPQTGETTETRKKTRESNSIFYPRVTVRLTGDVGSAISDIQGITSASSPSEVVRRAILIYHTLVMQKLKGNDPIVEIKEDGEYRKIPIFL
jgi:hypothetical protein